MASSSPPNGVLEIMTPAGDTNPMQDIDTVQQSGVDIDEVEPDIAGSSDQKEAESAPPIGNQRGKPTVTHAEEDR